ncbi:MAG: hypothetical protein H6631_07075 [Anaerolineaceae bacterium]|nr:hypothetical protein [Anaerolineaceae bacterium]
MSQQELLEQVIGVLDEANIDYMVTGSVASSLQGEPRATHDIDLVVDIQVTAVPNLVQAFQLPDYYLDEDTVHEAIQRQGMFNLIDVNQGDKVDFWILTDDAFDQSRFSRRYSEEFMGLTFRVSSPEDTILAKLRWAKMSGGSEKQFIDALRVYEVQHDQLDLTYLEAWVQRLGVEELWTRLQQSATPL